MLLIDTLQPTHGTKAPYPCLEDELELAVYKFCVSLYVLSVLTNN